MVTQWLAAELAIPPKTQVNRICVLWILVIILLGLPGCRPGMLPAPLPTPIADSVATETQPTPIATSQPMAIRVPTPTSLPTDPSPIPSPILSIAPELPPIEPILITHGDRSLPYIALTFDACQIASRPTGYDETIIKILTATNTPATLFLGGVWMQSHPTQTQELAANPLFELGNHSWSHPDFAAISPEEMSTEILDTQNIMYKLTGRRSALFRFPYDTYSDEALAVVGQHGLRAIQGDVVTGDADPHVSAKAIVHVVTTQAQNGSIVIMHMNKRGWYTAEALPAVIQRLRDKGYTLVTVSQLLELAPPPASVADEDEHP
jgi:peptidoglycan/xylan/chitin deacetylase (PgdA/CDA1 family)